MPKVWKKCKDLECPICYNYPMYQEIFGYFANEHNLILLQTEIQDIIELIKKQNDKINTKCSLNSIKSLPRER